jgi:glycosyltransferase involved in cell wall biosynthesis
MSSSAESVSVVVMAFDEVASLEAVVWEIAAVLERIGRDYEILIVDDGSTDGTGALADRLAAQVSSTRTLHHPVNGGLGAVYRTGLFAASGDLLTFFPADGQFPATIIELFVPRMATHDLVLGYLPTRDSSLLARGLSAAEKVLYRALFGPFPKFQGILMVRRAIVERLDLRSIGRGWGVIMELVLRAVRGGYRVVSLPTEMRQRMSGRSKVNNLRTIWANTRQMLELRRTLAGPRASK